MTEEKDLDRLRRWVMNRLADKMPDGEIIKQAISGFEFLPAAEVRKEAQTLIDECNTSVFLNLATIDQIEDTANEILKSGRVLEYFKDVYKSLHSGDHEILEIITLAGAAAAAVTCAGIQPGFSGHKGAGKTSGTRAALHLWPEEFVVDGGLSNKALFYDTDLRSGCAVFSDDTYLPEDLQQTIKTAMSTFQEGAVYRTVGKGPNGAGNIAIKKKIPPRTLFLFTSIDDSGDQELSDRQYKLSLHPSVTKKKARVKFLQERLVEGRESLPVTPEVKICRQILRMIKTQTFRVKIPFALRLKFSNIDNMRDIEQFFDFLQAVTVLNYQNRSPVEAEGIITIESAEEDFHEAVKIFTCADDTRAYKLTKEERMLLDWLCTVEEDFSGSGVTESEIISKFGKPYRMSRSKIRRLLYGKDNDGGLCAKIPGMHPQKEQRVNPKNIDSRIMHNVIHVDRDMKSTLSDYAPFVTLLPVDPAPVMVNKPDGEPLEAAA